jgi:hypothetical protein
MDGVNAKLQSQPVLGYISASMAYNSPRHRWRYHTSKCITCILTPRHGPKLPTPAVPLTINLAPLDGLPAPRLASSLLNIALYHPSSKNDIFSSLPHNPTPPPLRSSSSSDQLQATRSTSRVAGSLGLLDGEETDELSANSAVPASNDSGRIE